MYLPYCGCLTSRWISTRRVLSVLSRVTMPMSVRRAFRSSAVFVSAIAVQPSYFFWAWACTSRCRCTVLMRAISRRAFRIWLGVSSRSVADWNRRSKRFFCTPLSVFASSSGDIFRYSAVSFLLMVAPSLRARAADEPALKRHLVGDAGERVAGGRLGQAGDFEQDHAGLDDRGPIFRLALAFAHSRLGRDRRHRLVREDADVKPAFAADRVRRR